MIAILIIYLCECKQCQYCFLYVGSTKTKFRYRISNYKSTHRKFRKKYVKKDLATVIKKSELKQKLFHEHCCSEGHQGIENLRVTLIDQVEDLYPLKKKELYWINRLNTWAPMFLLEKRFLKLRTESKKQKAFSEKAKVFYLRTHENVF